LHRIQTYEHAPQILELSAPRRVVRQQVLEFARFFCGSCAVKHLVH
jgi:hypothetical protein